MLQTSGKMVDLLKRLVNHLELEARSKESDASGESSGLSIELVTEEEVDDPDYDWATAATNRAFKLKWVIEEEIIRYLRTLIRQVFSSTVFMCVSRVCFSLSLSLGVCVLCVSCMLMCFV